LEKLELDESLLARVYESEDVTGKLTAEAAKLLGLTTDCLVVGGAGDCAAGAIGNGIVRGGLLSTSIGTSGVMFVHSDDVKIDPAGRLHTFCHAVRGKWHLMGVNLSAGGSLQWFRNQLCRTEYAAAKRRKKEFYETLAAEAARAPVGSDGLFFLPYLSGERTPHADPDARGCFVGLTLVHTRGHVVRSIIEGVTYSMRDSLEIIRELGVPVRQIRASGGGSQSPLWRQIQADVFGQKVVTLKAAQGPAYGVALLAAVGGGAFKNIEQACAATIGEDSAMSPGTVPVAQGRFQANRGLVVTRSVARLCRTCRGLRCLTRSQRRRRKLTKRRDRRRWLRVKRTCRGERRNRG
jgi:xylulokinase